MSADRADLVFVLLSFEGPDAYSLAGGLGVRVKGLSQALARSGFDTYLYFCGDPRLPGEEDLEGGALHYRRWCQWISARHPHGVYDGEEGKIRDWNASLPAALVEQVIAPAVERGATVVVMGEEWHTSWSMKLISDALYFRGLRDRVVMLWNANNLFGFNRIDWGSLTYATTVTTVSRYMKFAMWDWGQNPMVIPNGIPKDSVVDPDPAAVAAVRAAPGVDHLWFKIGRFDPDKRWLMAVSAVALMKRQGQSVKLVMRGGREAHVDEVLTHAHHQGLAVRNVSSPADAAGMVSMLRESGEADLVNLASFVPDDLLPVVYAAADAVLANSGHEPFGLVGLEVMAAGGLAVTGSTGEDYAEPYRNAVVLETEDPVEIVSELTYLKGRPKLVEAMRRKGRVTAREYVWERIVEQLLLLRISFAAARQGVVMAGERPPKRGRAARTRKQAGPSLPGPRFRPAG